MVASAVKRQSKQKPKSMAICFDSETTGLIENRSRALSRQPEVIEFYGCLVDLSTGKIAEELDLLIRPKGLPLEERITQITGLRDEDLADAPSFGEVAERIKKLFAKAPVAIAHNATFDRDMIEIEFERLGIEIQFPRLLCTVEQSIHVRGHRLTLSALHEHLFDEAFVGAHRAREDVAALLRCAVEMRRRDMI